MPAAAEAESKVVQGARTAAMKLRQQRRRWLTPLDDQEEIGKTYVR